MKCIVCRCKCTTYICEVCREGAEEVSDVSGRPIAVITSSGDMYKLPFGKMYKPNEKCLACKGFIEINQSYLCVQCERLAEKYDTED